MTEETRVGHAATSALQTLCKEYIRTFTVDGKFVGDVKYLHSYGELARYNEKKD